jgi:hypothetical protein
VVVVGKRSKNKSNRDSDNDSGDDIDYKISNISKIIDLKE